MVNPSSKRTQPELPIASAWLLRHYWPCSFGLFLAALPLVLWRGHWIDAWGVGLFFAFTLCGALLSKWNSRFAILFHLLSMFPYWAWYSGVAGGLPLSLGDSVPNYTILLTFPILILVAIEGLVGAFFSLIFASWGLLMRWSDLLQRLEGLFLLNVAVLIGLIFRMLNKDLERAIDTLRRIAYQDDLTELGNRRGLLAHVSDTLSKESSEGVLYLIDIERFRTINDALGHAAGDSLLREMGRRIAQHAGPQDFVARIGGNEFALFMEGPPDEEKAKTLALRLLQVVEQPFEIDRRVVQPTASIGITFWPLHGEDANTLLHSAAIALVHARKNPHRIEVQRGIARESFVLRRSLEVDLHHAVVNGQLTLHFQPIYDHQLNRVVGVEALVRWNHPTRGLLAPGAFIEMAEETSQIEAIDRWVLKSIMSHMCSWHAAGWDGWVAMNLSAISLKSEDLPAFIEKTLREESIRPEKLLLEITETAAMKDPKKISARLDEISRLGVRLAIDDFGTGYSTFAYLKTLPAKHIKLDRSFVTGLGSDLKDEQLSVVLLELASRWGLEVVAEGIEQPEQLSWLRSHGCRLLQGFLIAKPMPAEEVLGAIEKIQQSLPEIINPKAKGEAA